MTDEEKAKVQQQVQAIEAGAKQWLSAEAISRYGSLKAAFPERAVQIAAVIVQLAHAGQIKEKLSDVDFKSLLIHLDEKKRETKIRRI
ncbi:MAG: DNA-binding protein [Candidatus Nanoarchaeia archaeon]